MRPEQAAIRQSLFREVNERIQELASDEVEAVCECCDESCAEAISLTEEEYQRVRAVPTHFLVKPGHVLSEVERVVRREERFAVVEKVAPAATVAIRLDPRNRRARNRTGR